MSEMQSVAITGATGFIGSHLVRLLSAMGIRPIILSRRERSSDFAPTDARWLRLDLCDKNSLRLLLEREKPDVVIHLAGTRGRNDARGEDAACEDVNFQATVGLLDAAMNVGVRRIVMMGTAEEYGNQPGPLRETLSEKPTSAYGLSKARATNYARELNARAACPAVILRPFTVYGPGQPSGMFVAEAVECAVKNVAFQMSRGEQKRDLVFVEDVVSCLLAAAQAPGIDGRVINIGTGQPHCLRDVAERIWQLTDTSAPLLIGARGARGDELYDTWADITLARELLDWQPRTKLESGLKQTIDFARKGYLHTAEACTAT
ncbi:MAG: NAD(P)-dependent oxidoreductase [Blastocatellia bacterium]